MGEPIKIEAFEIGPNWEQKIKSLPIKKKVVGKHKQKWKGKGKKSPYIRDSVYELDEVLPYFHNGIDRPNEFIKIYNNREIRMGSKKYRLFQTKGVTCVGCGIEGKFFALERQKKQTQGKLKEGEAPQGVVPHDIYHFNLYGYNSKSEEVLITMDHIIPKSKGGKNSMDNLQVMCEYCNHAKDNMIMKEIERNKKK